MEIGSDDLRGANGIRLFFLIMTLVFFLFLLINVPQEAARANVYALIGVVSLLLIIFDRGFKGFEWMDSVLEEPAEYRPFIFKKIPRTHLLIAGLVFGLYTFFSISNTGLAIVNAPTFQVVPFAGSPQFQAFISGILGVIENVFFYSVVFPSAFFIFNNKLKIEFITLPLAVLATSIIFVIFHFFVYGTSNAVATSSVFGFAAINSLIVYATRSLIISDSWHFFNNASIVLFSTKAIAIGAVFG